MSDSTRFSINGSNNKNNVVYKCNDSLISSSRIEPINLTFGSTWGGGFPGLGENAERFINDLTQATDGLFNIDYVSANLNPEGAFSVFPKTASNIYQGYISADYYWSGYHPAYQFFTTTPFGMTTREHTAWLKFGGGQELWDELAALFNLKPFAMGSTGFQFGFWSKKKLNSVADLSGWRVRIPGAGKDILNMAGATAISLPGGAIYGALLNDELDATEWVGPYNDMLMNFGDVTQYHYAYAFHEPGGVLAFSMNLDLWNSLPRYLQKIIEITAERNIMDSFTLYEYNNAINLPLVYEGVSAEVMPLDIQYALKVSAKRYYEQRIVDLSGQPDVQAFYLRVINSYFTFLNRQQSWTQIQDSYTSSRDINLNLPLTANLQVESSGSVVEISNIALSLSPSVNTVTAALGVYLWNGNPNNTNQKITMTSGNYIINVPDEHPMAFKLGSLTQSLTENFIEVTSATTTIEAGSMVGTGFSILPNHKFYSGTLNVTVKQAFEIGSVVCGPHGYMGMLNRLMYV